MNDRELLELAAKAAGIDVVRKSESAQDGNPRDREFFILSETRLWNRQTEWNPLANDGDALRLAGQLQFDLVLGHAGATVLVGKKIKAQELCHPDSGGNYEATRRAIVRAAAAIGQAKK